MSDNLPGNAGFQGAGLGLVKWHTTKGERDVLLVDFLIVHERHR